MLPKSGMTDLDYELTCSSMSDTEVTIDVLPMMNTYEDFFCGLTADSHPSFKLVGGAFEGQMDRRGGAPVTFTVKCDPQGQSGEFVAHVAFILPEEKPFSKFFKITTTAS